MLNTDDQITSTGMFYILLIFLYSNFAPVYFMIGRQRRGARGASDKDVTPPMLAKVQGNLEVNLFVFFTFKTCTQKHNTARHLPHLNLV